jgi:phosphatidylserine decarboxylase
MSRFAQGIRALSQVERLNFLLTNRIPRRWATMLVGRISRIEQPLVTRIGFAIWQFFAGDFRLDEAQAKEFRSLRDYFTRELRPGVRPIDANPSTVTSPCDAIIGCCGSIAGITAIQAKGYPYTITDLLATQDLVDRYRDGTYVALRLRSNFYHRFHAPAAGTIDRTIYISGDTWNVNPIALERIERLYCKNERVVMNLNLHDSQGSQAMVEVAAILVASIRLRYLDHPLDLAYRGPNDLPCTYSVGKGDELGYFEQGSTIIILASPGFGLVDTVRKDQMIRMGEPLLRRIA